MTFYQLWGRLNPLDECFAWIRDKVPSSYGGEDKGLSPAHSQEGDDTSSQPTVYRRVNKMAKPRPGRAFNPVIGRPIQLPELASNTRKDDITKVLQTLQLIRARSGEAMAQQGREHLT